MLSDNRLVVRSQSLYLSPPRSPVTLSVGSYGSNTLCFRSPTHTNKLFISSSENKNARSVVVLNNNSILPSPSPSPSDEILDMFWVHVKQVTHIVKIVGYVVSAPFIVAFVVALINGVRYFFGLCTGDKKTILMLQVGLLGRKQLLRQQLDKIAQVKDATHLDGLKFKEVVDALFQRHDSCRFAYLSATQCSDERKFGDIKAEFMRSILMNPPSVFLAYYLFRFIIKSLLFLLHWPFKMAIKKLKYENKCSKQLFGQVLNRELVRYDRDEEKMVNFDGMKYEEAVGETPGTVPNVYFVVTLLVLASGKYSIPPLEGNTEHLKTILQKFYAIPESKIETVEVLRSPQTGDDTVSEDELKRDFPLLKPVKLSDLEG